MDNNHEFEDLKPARRVEQGQARWRQAAAAAEARLVDKNKATDGASKTRSRAVQSR